MKISLIISTYNRPDALKLCLLSAISQSYNADEIIIGDDGSTVETSETINEIRRLTTIPIIHVWHEDKGFRLAMMRNKSVAASSGDYIIEIDGDIILHRDFISDHAKLARKGHYLKGGRTNLGKKLTAALCKSGRLIKINIFTHGIESKPENSLHLLPIAKMIAPYYRQHKETALGCNMSFFREDFEKINGYDEFFEGWGGEDGDFGRRLQRAGVKKRQLKFAGIVYHLWHEDKYMYNKQLNFDYSMRKDEEQPIRCRDGVDKYLEGEVEVAEEGVVGGRADDEGVGDKG